MQTERNTYAVRHINSLKDLLKQSEEMFSDKNVFLVKRARGEEYFGIRFSEFAREVRYLGTELMARGLKGKKIALMGSNSYQWVLAYFAIACGIGTVVPLDKELTKQEVENLVKRSDCSAAFCTSNYKGHFENCELDYIFQIDSYQRIEAEQRQDHILHLVASGHRRLSDGDNTYTEEEIDPDQLASILFTSGTTGQPKGVMLSHKNLCSVIMSTSMIVKLQEDDCTLSFLPIHHSFESTLGIMTPIYQGGCVAFCEGLKYIMKNLKESRASIMVTVPLLVETVYKKIWTKARKTGKEQALKKAIRFNRRMKKVGIDLSRKLFKSIHSSLGGRLRMFICGAAPLNPVVLRGFADMGFVFLQGYGLTETAPLAAGMGDKDDFAAKPASCGPAIPGVEIKINDPDEEGIGEIYIRGDNVMMGYYDNPEATAEVMKDGWFASGDLGFLDKDGWLYLTGRSKNIIVTNTGKNIYPEEIEPLVNALDYVKDSMIYGLKQEGGSDQSVAVQIFPDYELIEEEKGDLSEEEIYELLREEIYTVNKGLPSYKRIKKIRVRKEDFIRTHTQKIKRKENL